MTPDRLPPHDATSEAAIIGCALADPSFAPELRPDWFYDLRFRTAAEVISAMAAAGKPVAADTVHQRLQEKGFEDPQSLLTCAQDACHSPAHFPYWASILQGKATLRQIIGTAQEAITAAYESTGDPAETLDAFERNVLAIRQGGNQAGGIVDLKNALHELTNDWEAAFTSGVPVGIRTGFYDLDKILGGIKPQQLVILAARPAVGKTSLALGAAERVALDQGQPVGFFSLEMSAKELLHRLCCSRAGVDGARLNSGKPTAQDFEKLAVAQAKIAKAPLYICDRGALTLAQLTAHARRMVQRQKITLLIVDYLGLLRSGEKGRSRYEETTLVSNGLKALAKELDVPVLALCQLNRDNDRDARPPRLSDLRDSGAIEQDADAVLLLHLGEDQTGETQTIQVIVAKHRNGKTGKAELLFQRPYTRFESLAFQKPEN